MGDREHLTVREVNLGVRRARRSLDSDAALRFQQALSYHANGSLTVATPHASSRESLVFMGV
jgi:hypothetical protein